jgi:putative transposase
VVSPIKYRHTVFTDAHPTLLEEITQAIYADFQTELLEFNGETNHVHLLSNFPPNVVLCRLVNSREGRLLPQDAPGVPRTGPAPL